MRLDKYVSQSSGLSRKEVKLCIRQRRVAVDGRVVVSANDVVNEHCAVTLDGEVLSVPGNAYYMLNKPQGVVCATVDSRHPTVVDLIAGHGRRLHPVGRLDLDTTGLVLLTDDGLWSHAICSPKRKKSKTYEVMLAEPLVENAEKIFEQGMALKGEVKPTLPAALQRLSPTKVKVTLYEGRYHQVKRMFAALGNCVIGLHRLSIGSLVLDPTLQRGEYRMLTTQEVENLR